LRYTARIRTYHVVGLFIKETLWFSKIEPVVLGRFKIRILFLFILNRLIFTVFIELPLHCFAHKNSV
jgi:hypothetical protein